MSRIGNLVGRALRETGQAMDRLALKIEGNEIYRDTFTRHRAVMSLFGKNTAVESEVFVAPSAAVIGAVSIKSNSSIWYNAVLRGDTDTVSIGEYTNIQDRAVIVTNVELKSSYPYKVDIGDHVTIGHGAMLTSCSVGNHVLIGQGAIIQEGVVIGDKCMVAAGAVLLPGTQVPGGQLWGGNPASFMRNLNEADIAALDKSAKSYSVLAAEHAKEIPTTL